MSSIWCLTVFPTLPAKLHLHQHQPPYETATFPLWTTNHNSKQLPLPPSFPIYSHSFILFFFIHNFTSEFFLFTEDRMRLLPATNDDHGGVIVDMEEPMDSKVFLGALRASMSQWKHEGKRGVWIKLPIGFANLVETVVKEGFWYHHAEPNYLMLVYWIPETICTIPINATHRIGVGAIVLTDEKEILVVQENSGRFRGTGIWKIPTGVVDEGEDISVAAVREVKEETGNLSRSLHSGKLTRHSSKNQICSFCASCNLHLSKFRSKIWRLRLPSGCRLETLLLNLYLRGPSSSSA
ncbi:nudix hydrolase 2-like isoform X2 [Amaranthus tricolor]|uniref:nudix hydrolase 2-like isoform X2 n=1 Tax=Amaranthus tricolor TaxID=29722 RepID=UPI00258B22EC|nr:nudix hydrolase 2-like isoform X2 [Amaranthus tricolor]